MESASLRGVYVPLVTPYDQDGSVALDPVERLANRYLDEGATGLVALATTGEASLLDDVEKNAIVDVCAGMR